MANTRRIGVQLDFTANMSQAKQAVNEFKQSLTNVMTTLPSNKMTATAVNSLKEAQVAAQQLDLALTRAFNKNTGNINITKFSQSLKSSGTNVKQLSNSLLNAGKVGQQSFLAMARALQQVERSTITINGLTQRLVTTLWNNVRWQVTSAAINSVTTSISDAVNHLKDMDNALNKIRVVSGDTKVEMKGIADEARRMAKDLKTSATEIVKAELIYRQQGDSAELAAKKAEITTKAANVSFNSSAEQMSEYLTAIWNSYQVPEDQLELFVDKIAAIGATTATSMEEIATAMQKVASTANNVGVSYDQLAAVIATVSSTTRQSAESVGTSFKTIFARIEDLKLGKTTEDGVVLGTVSSDLEKMGISIYDTQGELKQLGDVLEEMGTKWQTMSKEEQVALAQTVGGKRQYSMLMALMDNWDMYSETVKEAANAYGTLDEQQSIWAESWEAHVQQVQVSAERVYDSLLKSDSVLTAMNGFSWFLERIADATDAAGGLGNILLWIGTIMASRLTPQIMNSINSIASGYDIISGRAKRREIELQNELTAQLQQIQNSQAYTGQQKLEASFLAENAKQKQKILNIEENLSEKQKEELNSLISVRNGWQEIALQEQAAIDKKEEYLTAIDFSQPTGKYLINRDASIGLRGAGKKFGTSTISKNNLADVATKGIQAVYGGGVSYKQLAEEIGIAEEALKEFDNFQGSQGGKAQAYFTKLLVDLKLIKPEMKDLSVQSKKLISSFKGQNIDFGNTITALNQLQMEAGETGLSTEQIETKLKEFNITIKELPSNVQAYVKSLNRAQFSEEKLQQAIVKDNDVLIKQILSLAKNKQEREKLKKVLKELGIDFQNLAKATKNATVAEEELAAAHQKMAVKNAVIQSLTTTINVAMTAFMAINQVEAAIDNFNDGKLTEGWTNIFFTLMNISSVIPGILAVQKALVIAGVASGAAWGWIAVVGVAIAGLIIAVKQVEKHSVKGLVEKSEELKTDVQNISNEIKDIDSQISDLKEKNEKLTDQEREKLRLLKEQKRIKEELYEEKRTEEDETLTELNAKIGLNSVEKGSSGSQYTTGYYLDKSVQGVILSQKKALDEAKKQIQQSYKELKEIEDDPDRLLTDQIYPVLTGTKNRLRTSSEISSPYFAGISFDKGGSISNNVKGQGISDYGRANIVDSGTVYFYQQSEEFIRANEKYKKDIESRQKIENDYKNSYDKYTKEIYNKWNEVKDKEFYVPEEGEELTEQQKLFNQNLERIILQKNAIEAINVSDYKAILEDIAIFSPNNEWQNWINSFSEGAENNLENLEGFEEKLEYLNNLDPTGALTNAWIKDTNAQRENFQSLKILSEQYGITVNSINDVDEALKELSKLTGISPELIQNLYKTGSMSELARGGVIGLKDALITLSNTKINDKGLVDGLKNISMAAMRALNRVLAVNGLRLVPKVTKMSMPDFDPSKSFGENEPIATEWEFELYKGNTRVGIGTQLNDLLNSSIKDEDDTSKTPSETPSESPGGSDKTTEEKDEDKADKIWWDDYEARKKQIEEDFAAGKIDQDKYLSELDTSYQDLISHYDTACEDHKDKILGELDDLKDKNASRNIELYKSISEAVQTYGYASFNYKGQQRTISSVEEADKFWTDELAGQTIKDPRTTNPISIYGRENLLDVNKTQWDNAKYISDEAWDQLQEDFEKGRIGFQEYWDKKTSLLYGGAWDKESNSIKRFYTKDEIDKSLGSDQKQSDFLTWVDNIIKQYETAAKDGQDVKWQNVIAAIIEQWGLLPPYLQTRDIKEQVQSKIQSMLDNYISKSETDTDKGFITPSQAKSFQEEVASFNWLGTPFEELAASSGKYYNQAQENFARRWENQSAYGNYIEGTDKNLRLAHLETIARNAVETRKNVLKTASVTSEEFAKAQKAVKDAGQAIVDEWYDQKITNAEGYLSWSKMFGFIEGDDSLKASLRMWDHIPEELKPKLKELVDQGIFTLEEAQKIYDAKVQSTYQSATSNMKEWLDFQRENTEEWINTQKTLLENSVSANRTNFDYQKSLRDSLHDINKELATSLTMYDYLDEETRKLLFNTDDYLELSGKINELQEEGNALTDKYLKDIQGKSIKEQELITQAYEAQMELKSKEYEIAKQDLEVAKKKLALQNVLNERNTRMFLNGQWTWVANQEEVAKAQQDLMDAQYQAESARLELEFTQEQEKLNARIRGLQEQLNIIEDDFKRLDDLINGRDRSVVMTFEELRDEVARTYKDIAKMREEAERENKNLNDAEKIRRETGGARNPQNVKTRMEALGVQFTGNIFTDSYEQRGNWKDITGLVVNPDGSIRAEDSETIYIFKKEDLQKHATGGIFTVPHLAQFAEDGAEAVIPLSDKYRSRGLELWNKAGNILGTLPQFSYKPSFAESGEQTIEQKVYVNIHNEDSTEDFYEINNLV